mgnify:CR=1 FL=1
MPIYECMRIIQINILTLRINYYSIFIALGQSRSLKESLMNTCEHLTVYFNYITKNDGAVKVSEQLQKECDKKEPYGWQLNGFQIFENVTVISFSRSVPGGLH